MPRAARPGASIRFAKRSQFPAGRRRQGDEASILQNEANSGLAAARRLSARRTAGFSLVEVLFALAVAGLMLGATAGVFRNGLLGHGKASDAATAVALAEQKLAEAGVTAALRPGDSAGAFGRFRWRLTIADFADQETPPPPLRLYRVAAQIEWSDGPRLRQYRLSTVRLGPAPP